MATSAWPRLGSCCLTTCSSDRLRVECPHSPKPASAEYHTQSPPALPSAEPPVQSFIVSSLQARPSTLDSGLCSLAILPRQGGGEGREGSSQISLNPFAVVVLRGEGQKREG